MFYCSKPQRWRTSRSPTLTVFTPQFGFWSTCFPSGTHWMGILCIHLMIYSPECMDSPGSLSIVFICQSVAVLMIWGIWFHWIHIIQMNIRHQTGESSVFFLRKTGIKPQWQLHTLPLVQSHIKQTTTRACSISENHALMESELGSSPDQCNVD